MALSLSGDEHVSLDWVRKQFPNAREEGVSLKQIESVMKEKGYFTLFLALSEREILGKPKENVYITLETLGNGAHLVVKKKTIDNELMLVDFPQRVKTYTVADSSNERQMTLLISKEAMPFSWSDTSSFNVFMIAGLALIAVSLFLIAKKKIEK
jgi:LPXTG-motif cell wall-anchored protein